MRQAPQPPEAVAEPQGLAPLLLAAWVGAGEGFTRSSISINSEVHSSKKTKLDRRRLRRSCGVYLRTKKR
jgi:hypothetical protein